MECCLSFRLSMIGWIQKTHGFEEFKFSLGLMEFYEDALKPETRDFYNKNFGFQYVALIGLRSLRFCAFIMNCL